MNRLYINIYSRSKFRSELCQVSILNIIYLRIYRYFCSVHEEITSIRLYTPGNPRARVCTTWLRLFRMNRTNNFDQSLWITSNFFALILKNIFIIFKIRQIIEIDLNNPKGASFKEITWWQRTARDALRTTSIFRFRSLTNNLKFLSQSKHV
jgi:hypothetical protein